MKKTILVILTFVLLAVNVKAEEYTYSAEEVGEDAVFTKWEELCDSLPEDLKTEFGSFELTKPEKTVKEKTSFSYWLDRMGEQFGSAFSKIWPNVVGILAILFLSAVAEQTALTDLNGISRSKTLIEKMTISLSLTALTNNSLAIAQLYLTRITSLLNLLAPVMDAVCLYEGKLTEASVSSSGVMLAVTVLGNINSAVIAPIVSVLFSLAVVGTVATDVNLGGLTASVRKLIMRIWQTVTLFFSFMIGTQSIIARSADTLATRTARFAIGTMVPVAGGILAEAYNTVKEGVRYIRSASGIGGIILVLLIFLSGIVPLLSYKAVIWLSSFVSGMLKLDFAAKLLEEIKGILDLIIAVVLYTSMMLVFGLVLFAKAREA